MGRRSKNFRRGHLAHQYAEVTGNIQKVKAQHTLATGVPGTQPFIEALTFLEERQQLQELRAGYHATPYQKPGSQHGPAVRECLRRDRQTVKDQAAEQPAGSMRGNRKRAVRQQFDILRGMYRDETRAGHMPTPAQYRHTQSAHKAGKERRTRSSWPFGTMTVDRQQAVTEARWQQQQNQALRTKAGSLATGFKRMGAAFAAMSVSMQAMSATARQERGTSNAELHRKFISGETAE